MVSAAGFKVVFVESRWRGLSLGFSHGYEGTYINIGFDLQSVIFKLDMLFCFKYIMICSNKF